MRLSILFSLALAISIPLSLTACGDETTSSGGDGACFDYASFNGTTPAVTFQANVLPIFRTSCGLSASCHGTPMNSLVGQVYLGPPNSAGMASQSDIDAIFAEIINVDATKESGMKVVVPSDAANSFLMHKIDASFKCESLTCDGNCGTAMPPGAPLTQDQKDTIRRWIAQGAKND